MHEEEEEMQYDISKLRHEVQQFFLSQRIPFFVSYCIDQGIAPSIVSMIPDLFHKTSSY